jgi:hypothetical protein
MALFDKALGKRVIAGGPALFLDKMGHEIRTAEVGGVFGYPDAVPVSQPDVHHVQLWMPGRLRALHRAGDARPKVHAGARRARAPDPLRQQPVGPAGRVSGPHHRPLRAEDVPMLDANSGFEPRTFTEEVYRRWKPLLDENLRTVALRL